MTFQERFKNPIGQKRKLQLGFRRMPFRVTGLQSILLCLAVLTGSCGEESVSLPRTTSLPDLPSTFPSVDRWESIDPAEIGWDSKALSQAAAIAKWSNGSSLLVVYRGRIIAEHYWPLDPQNITKEHRQEYFERNIGVASDGTPLVDVTSIQKSVASILVAIAIDRGLLDPEKSVTTYLGEGWSQAKRVDEELVLLRHVMNMTSGLNHDLEFEHPAGVDWRYNPLVPQILMDVLQQVSGMEPDQLLAEWLTDPLGAKHSKFSVWPGDVKFYGLHTTSRDLARFGWLIASDGRWENQSLISPERTNAMLQTSQDLNPIYGMLWFLNKPGARWHSKRPMKKRPFFHAPLDLVLAMGALDIFLSISPSEEIVIIRIGATVSPNNSNAGIEMFNSIWEQVLAAKPLR